MSSMNRFVWVAVVSVLGCGTDDAIGSGFGVHPMSSGSSSTGTSGMEEPGPEASSTTTGEPGGSGGASASGSSTTSTTGGAEPGNSSSGAPAYCGDGVVNPPDEECDDGNDRVDDGCYACLKSRKVFMTSEVFKPNFGGLAGADSLCRQFANKGGLARWQTYRAWMSDSETDAVDRIYLGPGIYVRLDQEVVVDQGEKFLSGEIGLPIEIDEHGETVVGLAWTGTRPDGTAVPDAGHCSDWTSDGVFEKGYYGIGIVNDSRWTLDDEPKTNPTSCIGEYHLYCIEGE